MAIAAAVFFSAASVVTFGVSVAASLGYTSRRTDAAVYGLWLVSLTAWLLFVTAEWLMS